MKLAKLFEMQRVLDERIIKEKGLEGQGLLPNTILALQVELGELANEWRGFKHWSNRKTPKMYPQETCDYCGEETDYTRPTPFMADTGASMCKSCWTSTKEEYSASNDEYIPDFEDYPHFPPKQPTKLLEEYVDCLHFILSIGNKLVHRKPIEIVNDNDTNSIIQFDNLTDQLLSLFSDMSELWEFGELDESYSVFFTKFINLGEMLGFALDQIEQAYMDKNKVNHERQDSGY